MNRRDKFVAYWFLFAAFAMAGLYVVLGDPLLITFGFFCLGGSLLFAHKEKMRRYGNESVHREQERDTHREGQ